MSCKCIEKAEEALKKDTGDDEAKSSMKRLRQGQWDVLLCQLEKSMNGADCHDIRAKFCTVKDKVDFWCSQQHKPDKVIDWWHEGYPQSLKEYCDECVSSASAQLKKWGYDDINLFIEEAL